MCVITNPHYLILCLLYYASFLQVAMGQGQSNIALRLLRDCAANGDWLCLKNLHLMIHWLSVLEKVRVERMKVESCILHKYSDVYFSHWMCHLVL